MSVFEDAVLKGKEFAGAAAKKAGEAVDYSKAKIGLMELRKRLEKAYIELGKLSHDEIRNGADNSPQKSVIAAQVSDLIEVIAQKEKDSAVFKNVCPSCGRQNSKNAYFCNKCGAKL